VSKPTADVPTSSSIKEPSKKKSPRKKIKKEDDPSSVLKKTKKVKKEKSSTKSDKLLKRSTITVPCWDGRRNTFQKYNKRCDGVLAYHELVETCSLKGVASGPTLSYSTDQKPKKGKHRKKFKKDGFLDSGEDIGYENLVEHVAQNLVENGLTETALNAPARTAIITPQEGRLIVIPGNGRSRNDQVIDGNIPAPPIRAISLQLDDIKVEEVHDFSLEDRAPQEGPIGPQESSTEHEEQQDDPPATGRFRGDQMSKTIQQPSSNEATTLEIELFDTVIPPVPHPDPSNVMYKDLDNFVSEVLPMQICKRQTQKPHAAISRFHVYSCFR